VTRLTDDFIRRAERPTEGQILHWDDLVSGFGVRLTPTKTSFVVQWHEKKGGKNGRKPRESLRPHWPQLEAARARELARKRLAEVLASSEGQDARELRQVIREWFERKTALDAWRPKYRAKVDALIKHYIEGEQGERLKLSARTRLAVEQLGLRPVSQVTRADVMRVVDGIKPGAGEQLMGAVVSPFYNDMFDRGVNIPNPGKNRLRVFGGRRVRRRILTDAEFLALWRALEKEGDRALACFAVLGFTGARRREATQMRRAEIDLEAATWTLPPERRKTGRRDPEPFVIHLHPHLVERLSRQPVLAGSPFVFWGRRDQRPFEFHYALMHRLHALGIDDWRLHDVRRYVRSGMAKLGVPQAVAELCLGHVVGGGLVQVYDVHTYQREKREAWQRWGDYLVTLVGKDVR
jgi:integrase